MKSNANHQNTASSQSIVQHSQQQQQKGDQKPVECNLCHRKFKNIPALNGHMRLHGGYFKKDSDSKKSDKKESSGPPLQTASVGVRALIEEKIINKRSKQELKVLTVESDTLQILTFNLIFKLNLLKLLQFIKIVQEENFHLIFFSHAINSPHIRELLSYQQHHCPLHDVSLKQKLF